MMNVIFEKMRDLVPNKICIKARENGDVLIVSNSKRDIVYLNETSKDFYSLCDGVRTISQICTEMLGIYNVSSDELEHDIISLVRDMQWNDLIDLKGVPTCERV